MEAAQADATGSHPSGGGAPPFDAAAVRALAPRAQGDVEPYAPITGPYVWCPADFPDPAEYTVELGDRQLAELEAAVDGLLGGSGRLRVEGNHLAGVGGAGGMPCVAAMRTRALGPMHVLR